jgi:hypothetical protein
VPPAVYHLWQEDKVSSFALRDPQGKNSAFVTWRRQERAEANLDPISEQVTAELATAVVFCPGYFHSSFQCWRWLLG